GLTAATARRRSGGAGGAGTNRPNSSATTLARTSRYGAYEALSGLMKPTSGCSLGARRRRKTGAATGGNIGAFVLLMVVMRPRQTPSPSGNDSSTVRRLPRWVLTRFRKGVPNGM